MTTDSILMIFAGATGAAVVNLIGKLIQWWLDRKAKRNDDKAMSVEELGERISVIEDGLRVILHDRIKHLARCYIERKEADYDDYKDLKEMHDTYRALGGDNLVRPMEDVSKITMIYK